MKDGVFAEYKEKKRQLEIEMGYLQKEFEDDVEDDCEYQRSSAGSGDKTCGYLMDRSPMKDTYYCSLHNCPFTR